MLFFEELYMTKFLIVGLGNPGAEYAHTRHNIGFDVVDAFVAKYTAFFTTQRLAEKADVQWKSFKFICIKPTTYMNLSGKAFRYWLEKEKIELQHTLTIVDDLELPLEKIRIRPGGSAAGHNGLKDIENTLGTQQYPRLRFGIGNHFPKGMQVQFVLGKWQPDELPLIQNKINACVQAIECFATEGIEKTMNLFNNLRFDFKKQ